MNLLNHEGQPLFRRDVEFSRRTKGDVTLSFQWIKTNTHPDGIEAMVFWRNTTQDGARFCLQSDHISYYAENTGYATEGLMVWAEHIAKVIGFNADADKHAVRRIADMVLDGLEELIRMPPPPEDVGETQRYLADMVERIDGKVTNEFAI